MTLNEISCADQNQENKKSEILDIKDPSIIHNDNLYKKGEKLNVRLENRTTIDITSPSKMYENLDMTLPKKYVEDLPVFDERLWQNYSTCLMDRLSYIMENGALSDVDIELIDGRSLKMHKFMLALYSPVYATMFYGSFPQVSKVAENTTYETFNWISNYMYKGVITIPNIQLALELYIFAHQKQIDFIVQRCSTYLSSHLDSENVFQVMEVATLYEDESLKQECTKIIFSRRNSLFLTEELHYASKNVLLELLNSGRVKYTEKTIFKTIQNWAETQIKNRNETISASTIRKEMDIFIPLIDFISMPLEFYIREVMTSGILTPEEGLAILRKQKLKEAPMPSFLLGQTPVMRRIRFDSESSTIQRIELIKKPMCNFTFLYNHNNEKFSDKIFVITASEKIYLWSVKVRCSCYTGSWRLCITDKSDRQIGSMSSEGPPWNFEAIIPLSPDTTYVGKIIGKGKIAKHSIDEYYCSMNGICFSGMSIACKLGIVYWT